MHCRVCKCRAAYVSAEHIDGKKKMITCKVMTGINSATTSVQCVCLVAGEKYRGWNIADARGLCLMRVDYPPHEDLDCLMHPERALGHSDRSSNQIEGGGNYRPSITS